MTIDTQRKELRSTAKISQTTIHGWPSIFFSLPFIGAGAFIVLVSLGVIPVDDSSFHAPRLLVASFGGFVYTRGSVLINPRPVRTPAASHYQTKRK